jgi:FkbM family methyltransferase
MANILVRAAGKAQRIMLFELMRAISLAEQALDKKMSGVEKVVQDTQRQINHEQTLLLREVKDRVKNGGTMHLSESEIITKIFSGIKMYLDPRDIAVVPHLVLDGVWEHRITAAWLKVVKPTDTVIDIGANFGYFGALAAQLTDKKRSKVVMFEANPHLMPYLRKTMSVNWFNEQTVIENLAVADKKGEVTLHLLKDYIGSSSLYSPEQLDTYMHDKMYLETQEQIKVQAVTIDEYCKQHGIKTVDLIKMDIEGYEDKAYQGMRKIVAASPNITMFVEFTPDGYEKPKAFYEQMLKDFGHVYVMDDDGRILKPADTSYAKVIGDTDDWVMPIFSKNATLAD